MTQWIDPERLLVFDVSEEITAGARSHGAEPGESGHHEEAWVFGPIIGQSW